MTGTEHHRIVVVGGGTAGITVAARLRRRGQGDVALIEPSDVHYYQPLWTLVGGGCAKAASTVRAEARQIPDGVEWVRDAAVAIDPEARTVTTAGDRTIGYDALIVCPGIQMDWDAVPGLPDALGHDGVSSNYTFDLAPKTWDMVRQLRGGSAVFTDPSGPLKCGGAPQKAAYLSCDQWRRAGVLADIDVHLLLPGDSMFGVPEFRTTLEQVVERYGIEVHFQSEMTELRPEDRRVVVTDHGQGGSTFELDYDFLHAVPPMRAPDWLASTAIATGPHGFVEVDQFTLQHPQWPTVFSLGDASGAPNSKTGAAVRKQAPVVVDNVLDVLEGRPPTREYHGYSSCPIVTGKGKLLLCEFDYDGNVAKSIPVIDTTKERYDMWLLKKYGLPLLYWHGMLKGLA